MFTGIVEARSQVVQCQRQKKGALLAIQRPRGFAHLRTGCSIAVNGVCLTLVRADKKSMCFEVVSETLKRSNLGDLKAGSVVNLERALLAKGRIEGHFVLGHVDGMGDILDLRPQGMGVDIRIGYPVSVKDYVIEKGSIAVNGVSLTIGKTTPGSFWIHAIPHTLKATGMGSLRAGQRVNLEADILLKFLHRLMIS